MDNVNLILIDCGKYFLARSNKCDVKIDYKLYSMMAGSIDYQKTKEVFNNVSFQNVVEHIASLRYKIEDCKSRGVPEKNIDKYYNEFYQDISLLYDPVCSLVDTGHLDGQQLSLVMELFMHEFTMHFKSGYFDWHDARTYTPSILSSWDLKDYINSSLINDGINNLPLLKVKEELEHTKIVMTFTTFDGISRPVYNIRNTLDFLMADLHKCSSGKEKIKRCAYCERLFFAFNGRKYCRLPHKDTDKTCNLIIRNIPKDELDDAFKKARYNQRSKRDYDKNTDKYGESFMHYIYDKWLEECEIQYARARRNNDKEGFKKWVEDTNFLRGQLPPLYEKYKNEMDKAGKSE